MSPSRTIIRDAVRTIGTIDKTGRRLLVRRPTALDTLRLFKAAGPILAQNEAWLSMAGLAFSVVEIDGVPVPTPATEAQIEGLVERLGDEGLSAIAESITDGNETPAAEKRLDVGNSLGTLS